MRNKKDPGIRRQKRAGQRRAQTAPQIPVFGGVQFNYPIDIVGKWHGAKYRFIQRYRSGFEENPGEEFDAPFARLDWIGRDRFDIQWHRHTGEWHRLHRGLNLVDALETLRTDQILHPV